ncbi:CPBP family intramembrane metalloprotease [Hanstruepera neustonica]|uniref:CPBP family intramembrane metalloprotease n=1 Tax=Hanstruepera neustonica TaxID=1445657 RepID=A0A2K1DZG8_9FLAO|nr:CPBP family intramembrane glutamic endopeptidase [Hanstruepera neustonica]PNQ73426.1 CPBP family intramembrane metalloprotease [Hanstruepera neustonica]
MLGLLIILVISWAVLRFIEKKNIDVLGVIPYPNRILQFFIGLVFMMFLCLLMVAAETYILNVKWKQKETIDYSLIFQSFIYHIRSALTEDLVFRGAILYVLIRRIGSKKAILLSALCFGVYHVFSYGMMSEGVIPIVYVILVTGFTGYVWAYAFYKTKSIMLGLGIHLGYNFLMTFFYESYPYGELVFVEMSKTSLQDWNWVIFNLSKGLLPSIFTLVFVNYLIKSKSILKSKSSQS